MGFAKMLAVTGLAVLALGATAAKADWDLGDPCKMHWPQLPDPQGWDVFFHPMHPLADDWQCTQTGFVSDIHFWLSSKGDAPFTIQSINVAIHDDDRTGEFSKPGEARWSAVLETTMFTIRDWPIDERQGWYDPGNDEVIPGDHTGVWQVNIVNIPEPFWQERGKIYWLELGVFAQDAAGEPASLGWKTSGSDPFEDDAVWLHHVAGAPSEWLELVDPSTGASLDLAFVITPEPATLALTGLGLAGLVARRRRNGR